MFHKLDDKLFYPFENRLSLITYSSRDKFSEEIKNNNTLIAKFDLKLEETKKNLLKQNNVQEGIKLIEEFVAQNQISTKNSFVFAGVYVLCIISLNSIYVGLSTDMGEREKIHHNQLSDASHKNKKLLEGYRQIKKPKQKALELFKQRKIQFLPIFKFPCDPYLDKQTESLLKNRLNGLEGKIKEFLEQKTDYNVANESSQSSKEQWAEKEKLPLFLKDQDLAKIKQVLTDLQKEKIQKQRNEKIVNPVDLFNYYDNNTNKKTVTDRISQERAIVAMKTSEYFPIVRCVSIFSINYNGRDVNYINRKLNAFNYLKVQNWDLRYASDEEMYQKKHLKLYDDQVFHLHQVKKIERKTNASVIYKKRYFETKSALLRYIQEQGTDMKSTHSITIMITNSRKNWIASKIPPECRMASDEEWLYKEYFQEYDNMEEHFFLIDVDYYKNRKN